MSFILLGVLNTQAGGGAAPYDAIYLGLESSPYIEAYTHTGSAWGTKFSNPSTLPTDYAQNVAVSRLSDALVMTTNATGANGIIGYPISEAGFGTKYSDPGALSISSGQKQVDFSPTEDYLALGPSGTQLQVWEFDAGSGFGTRYVRVNSNNTRGVRFSFAGTTIALGFVSPPRFAAVGWSSGSFGSYATASGASNDTGFQQVTWHPSDTDVGIAQDNQVNVWPWSGSAFGSLYSRPVGANTLFGSPSFDTTGNYFAQTGPTSPYAEIFPFTSGSGFGTVLSNPATLPTGTGRVPMWSSTGDSIAIGHLNSPYVSWYAWTGSAWGSKYADPAVLPSGAVRHGQFTVNP